MKNKKLLHIFGHTQGWLPQCLSYHIYGATKQERLSGQKLADNTAQRYQQVNESCGTKNYAKNS